MSKKKMAAKKTTNKTVKVKEKAVGKATVMTPPVASSKAKKRPPTPALSEQTTKLASKWAALQDRAQEIKTEVYSMKKAYEPETAINHKILGWGYIMSNINDRLQVLFKDGIKYLISNYK